MNLIKPSFEIIEQPSGIEGMYKHIELCGRTCYKSQDRITEDSAKKFVDGLIKSGHGSVLEHGTIYFKIPESADVARNFLDEIATWTKCKHITCSEENWWAVTTNFRVMIEHFATEYMEELIEKYLCEPTEYHERRVTVKFNCDIGISREFNRHRVNSISEQSTRYCNYTKEKFGNGLNVMLNSDICETDLLECIDDWDCFDQNNVLDENQLLKTMCKDISEGAVFDTISTWLFANLMSQWSYNRLIKLGWKPQQARRVLPLDLHTELIHTAFTSDWKHFFDLRDHSAAHPDAIELAKPLHKEFIKRNLI